MTSAVNSMQPIRSWHRLAIACALGPMRGYYYYYYYHHHHHHHHIFPHCINRNHEYKKAELSQRRPHDALYIWYPENFRESLSTPTATFPEICNGLLFRSILGKRVRNLKFVALPVPEIGGTQKNWAVPKYAYAIMMMMMMMIMIMIRHYA